MNVKGSTSHRFSRLSKAELKRSKYANLAVAGTVIGCFVSARLWGGPFLDCRSTLRPTRKAFLLIAAMSPLNIDMSTPTPPLRITPTLALLPPFAAEQSLLASEYVVLPAVVREDGALPLRADKANTYLEAELKTPKLDKVYDHLWLAGLPRPARSLHRQKLLQRNILITENPDEHLIWHESRIFVKPIPEFLLSYERWMKELCGDEDLHRSACGLLLSYTWLICHKSDFRIAKELGLLPEEVEWSRWISFVEDFVKHIDQYTLQQVSKRYRYGELRLSRLHSLYRFVPSMFSTNNFVRGYMSDSTWYRAYFKRNFAWLLAVFAYVTVILSAMQVGLASERLQGNRNFQDASWGFAVTSMVGVLATIWIIFIVWAVLFWYHMSTTRQYLRRMEMQWAKAV